MSSITDKIDAILQQRGMSRRQLAIAANISPSTFQAAMQRGKNMTIEMLQAVAAVLGVSESSFFEPEPQGFVKSDINWDRVMSDFLGTIRAAAQEADSTVGTILCVSPSAQITIDNAEEELAQMEYSITCNETNEYVGENVVEEEQWLYEEKEAEQEKRILDAILEAILSGHKNKGEAKETQTTPIVIDAQSQDALKELLSLYLQFSNKGQREILDWVQGLARLMVQIPAYRQHRPNFDDLRDVFGGRISFDDPAE